MYSNTARGGRDERRGEERRVPLSTQQRLFFLFLFNRRPEAWARKVQHLSTSPLSLYRVNLLGTDISSMSSFDLHLVEMSTNVNST